MKRIFSKALMEGCIVFCAYRAGIAVGESLAPIAGILVSFIVLITSIFALIESEGRNG